MNLYYTAVSQEDAAQSNPLNSLGGFCSSSPVQSDFNAIFGDISAYTLQKCSNEYIALMLKNTLEYAVNNLKFWLVGDSDPVCKMRIAVVRVNSNNEMEVVSSVNSKPLQAEFYEPTEDEPLEVDKILYSGGMLGIWVERSIITDASQVASASNCNYLYEKFKSGESVPTTESHQLCISWDGGDGSIEGACNICQCICGGCTECQ